MNILKSELDKSVNNILRTSDNGAIECRFVQRSDDYFIIYVSSHTGCNQGCRFCHLTQTGQTMMRDVTPAEFAQQVDTVLTHAKTVLVPTTKRVHINFMARGEPLLNPHLTDGLLEDLDLQCIRNGFDAVFKISTIFPVKQDVYPRFRHPKAQIYYSIYSTQKHFRRRWLPKAEAPNIACHKLHMWQMVTGQKLVLHYALIDGHNDSPDEARRICELVKGFDLDCYFNLVRYNPFDAKSKEPNEEKLNEYFNTMCHLLGSDRCRIIPRVGFDVKASCGMFA
jgi:23S rRNA (adenine2503-C2)-methyltransferase